ncbi:MAG: aminotransferase class I/II-fold pyridoxal phosphate-dependent enzyme [Lysobacteraceae bacterium]|nr:MAG: aminotransferase class I/II-fold pyridoxal phosphate-dependent enzyme [Xanthomonadaceae bacterium]
MSLAIETYRDVQTLGDGPALLNLSWTLDERDWLSLDLNALVADCLSMELDQDLAWTRRYLVKDPYGSDSLGNAVEHYFATAGLAEQITCAAGVNGLLHALAAMADENGVAMADAVYPDYAHWLQRRGIVVCALHDALPQREEALSAFEGIVHLERPALFPAAWDDAQAVRALCARMPRATILIDESNANYCAPAFSAAPLTREFDNLLVLRGLSKAYGMGSLRLGYCVSSAALTARVRRHVPALSASSLSLMIGREILTRGDISAPLRKRIAEAKAETRALLAACGADTELLPCGDALPYLLFSEPPSVLAETASVGAAPRILFKRHALWTVRGPREIHRCSVPLHTARMARLRECLTATDAGEASAKSG